MAKMAVGAIAPAIVAISPGTYVTISARRMVAMAVMAAMAVPGEAAAL
jgi:hypothetical protein